MTAPRIPHDDKDFRQLTGAFERPIAPSPHFADALKQRLEEEESTMQQVHALPSRPVSNRTARAMSGPPLTRRKWLDTALAAVLIVGMLGGSFWYADVRTGGDGPTGPEATRYAAQPLSSLSTPVVAEAAPVHGDPGNIRHFPAGFDLSGQHEAVVLDEGPDMPLYAALAGNTLVVEGSSQGDGEGSLYAIDLTTGSILWKVENIRSMREFIVGERSVFGAFATAATPDYAMTSISLDNGEVEWAGEPLIEPNTGLDVVSPAVSFNAFRPTVIGGMLYYVDRDGQVIALDAATGDQQWSVALEHESTEPGWGRGGSVVGNEDALYAVDGQNVIRKLDPATGKELDRFPMRDRPSSAYVMDLHLKDDSLVAISRSLDFEGTTGFVDAVSTDDGEVMWSQRLGSIIPFVTVTDDVVAVPHRVSETEIGTVAGDITKSGTYVSIFDLGTGDPVSLYGPSGAEGATVSSSGDVVCINEGTLISCVDTASAHRTLVSLPYAPGEESYAPLLFWNDTAIVLDMDDGVTLLQPVAAPQSAETTTDVDVEARGGSLGTADRSLHNPALDPIDGPFSLAWSHTASDPLWVLPYGDVVATLGSSEIAVHDATSGDMLWSKSTDEAFRNTTYDTERSPKALLGTRQGSPVALPWIVDDTMYYAGTTDLIGVDLHTGEEVFRTVHTVPDQNVDMNMFFFPWELVVKGDTAYILTMPALGQYVMTAMDLESGNSLWSYEAGEPVEDWASVTKTFYQPVITDELVVVQVLGEENTILALNRTDGSVAWEIPNALRASRNSGNFGSSISAIDDRYLILTDRNEPTGTVDGTPNADGSLGIALYDLESGNELWTASDNDFRRFGIEEATCGLATGWAESVLYIACTADDHLGLIGMHIDTGRVTYSGSVGTESPTYLMFQDSGQNLYYGGEKTLTRLNPATRQMEYIQLEGGDACVPNAASNEVVVCHTDDGIGTYGIQVYTRGPAATPQASPAASLVQHANEFGDPRNTGHYPAGFNISAPLTATPLGDNPPHATGGIIVGDLLIGERTSIANLDPATFSPNGLYAHDLRTGEVLWRNTEQFYTRYTADASGLYGLTHPVSNRQRLVALDLETGTERWRSEPLTGWSAYPEDAPILSADTPLVIEGAVYVPFTDGSVVAFDGATGDVLWEHEPESVPDIEEDRGGAAIVADERYLYASNAANTITVLELETGKLVRQFILEDLTGDQFWITLHLQGDRLAILGRNSGSGEPEGRIAVLDAATGESLWTADTGTVQSNLLVRPEMIGVVHVEFDTANRLERLLGQETSGDLEFSLYDLDTGEAITAPEGVLNQVDGTWQAALASSGDTICVSYTTVTCFDAEGTVSPVTGFETPHITTVGQQLLVWNGNLIILDARESTHIVRLGSAPVATPVSTPS